MSEVEYDAKAIWEESSIRSALSGLIDEIPDEEAIRRIEKEAEHNPWAWCQVKVTARIENFEGYSVLCCCNYADKKEFCQPGSYYDDMKSEALDHLKDKLKRAVQNGRLAKQLLMNIG